MAAKTENLWNPKKLEVNDYFSTISYLKVLEIEGMKVTVENQLGQKWFITRDLIENHMWSSDHYDTEVTCNMTELSEIL